MTLHRTQYELCSFLSSRKLWTMLHVVQDGWKSTTPIENGHGREEDIDLLWSIKVKLKETNLSTRRCLHGQ
jgi:hypothetical protein